MSALEFLLSPGMTPFTISIAVVIGLVLLELAMIALGGSLLGDGDAGLEADAGIELDGVEIDGPDLDGPDLDAPDLDGPDLDAPNPDAVSDLAAAHDTGHASPDASGPSGPSGFAGWLGFGEVPFILWLAGILTAFGLSGYVVQVIATSIGGAMLPGFVAAALALLPGLRLGALTARAVGKLLPKTETTAISIRSLGNRRGVIVQGTARRGRPAQARIRDAYGNWHYVRVEPVDEGVEIPQGTEILTRGRGPILGAIPITD